MTLDIEKKLIETIKKEFIIKNFYFNRNVVYYLNEGTHISPLPTSVPLFKDIEINLKKTDFETPLSHLCHCLIHIGIKIQTNEFENLINAICEPDELNND